MLCSAKGRLRYEDITQSQKARSAQKKLFWSRLDEVQTHFCQSWTSQCVCVVCVCKTVIEAKGKSFGPLIKVELFVLGGHFWECPSSLKVDTMIFNVQSISTVVTQSAFVQKHTGKSDLKGFTNWNGKVLKPIANVRLFIFRAGLYKGLSRGMFLWMCGVCRISLSILQKFNTVTIFGGFLTSRDLPTSQRFPEISFYICFYLKINFFYSIISWVSSVVDIGTMELLQNL